MLKDIKLEDSEDLVSARVKLFSSNHLGWLVYFSDLEYTDFLERKYFEIHPKDKKITKSKMDTIKKNIEGEKYSFGTTVIGYRIKIE